MIVTDAGRVGRVMSKLDKLFHAWIKTVQTTLSGSNPQIAIRILQDGGDPAVAQAARHVRIGFINLEGIAVIAIQTILRAHPQEAATILKDDMDGTLGHALF